MPRFFTRFGLIGHYWTVAPFLQAALIPRAAAPARPWSTTLEDPTAGQLKLTGFFAPPDATKALLVVVHGLGGSAESAYLTASTHAARAAGLGCLRLNLRGADRGGDDYYHAGLTADLDAALASAELRDIEHIFILGYSLGGHLTLRYATGAPDPRVRAVAAICAPLALDASSTAIDRPERWLYRRHVLRGLLEIYQSVAERRRVPLPLSAARRIRSIREWDHRIVAPRHGFESAEHYYSEVSVAGRLGSLKVPALLVQAEHDPMVLAETVRPALTPTPEKLQVEWVARGGHVGFPRDLLLGSGPARGVENAVVAWLTAKSSRSS
jgi:predicted alpha/beta-fold hydrolase